jgi:type IV pilus assembly protein PilB
MNVATANLVGITGITRRLVLDGVLSEADARKALDESSKAKKQAHLYLLENRMVSVAQVAAANSTEFGMPLFDATTLDPRYSAVKIISEDLIQKHQALPLYKRGNRLYVAVSDPTNTRALDDIKFATNLTVEPILVDED